MTRSILLNHTPDQVLRQLLIDLGVGVMGGKQGDWPIFCTEEPETPDECITLYWGAGQLDGLFQINGETQEHYGIQVRVRGKGYQSAYDKVKSVMLELEQHVMMTTVTVPLVDAVAAGTYVAECCTRASGPLYLGTERDNAERDVFTINYLATITQ